MSQHIRVSHPIYQLLPTEIEGFDSLAELALDMHWSWNHATDEVWRRLDPKLWEITHNPWVVLQTVSRARVESLFSDTAFGKIVDDLVQTRRKALAAPGWLHAGVSIWFFPTRHLEKLWTIWFKPGAKRWPPPVGSRKTIRIHP